jgi:hypothetical protein
MISTSLKLNIGICHFTVGCYGYGIVGLIVTTVITGYYVAAFWYLCYFLTHFTNSC